MTAAWPGPEQTANHETATAPKIIPNRTTPSTMGNSARMPALNWSRGSVDISKKGSQVGDAAPRISRKAVRECAQSWPPSAKTVWIRVSADQTFGPHHRSRCYLPDGSATARPRGAGGVGIVEVVSLPHVPAIRKSAGVRRPRKPATPSAAVCNNPAIASAGVRAAA